VLRVWNRDNIKKSTSHFLSEVYPIYIRRKMLVSRSSPNGRGAQVLTQILEDDVAST